MTLPKQVDRLLVTAIISSFIGLVGCQRTGMERSNEARISLQTMDEEITSAILQLDATGTTLTNLIKPGQPDPKKALHAFSENVTQIIATETKFARHADKLSERGTDYFEEWQKEGTEYKNPQIQQLSENRRSIVSGVYGRIAHQSIGVTEAFKLYVSNVKEIQMFLSNDLSTNGMTAIAPTAHRVITDGDSLKEAMQNVIQSARREMAQIGSGM
ncbi:MAG TPA: DUF2959 family protein [Balneolaceae bacterium]|nr:DUF2959 family protein [Balneolaceae bacterium]